MAISVRVASPGALLVSHQLLDGSALAEQALAVHVAACAPAASLLDLSSDRLLPKASLLPFAFLFFYLSGSAMVAHGCLPALSLPARPVVQRPAAQGTFCTFLDALSTVH